MLKSFYTLEMNVDPGGARYATLLVTNSIAEIKLALQLQFSHGPFVDLLLVYGMYVCVCTYQKGEMVSYIDLLSYLSVESANGSIYTIDEDLEVTPDLDDWDCDRDYTMFINWSSLEIPELLPPLLLPGEVTLVNDHYHGVEITPELVEMFLFLESRIDWDKCRAKIYATAAGDWDDDLDDEDLDDEDNFAEDFEEGYAFYGWNDRELSLEMPELERYFAASKPEDLKVVFR
jgi:hypothetical protein